MDYGIEAQLSYSASQANADVDVQADSRVFDVARRASEGVVWTPDAKLQPDVTTQTMADALSLEAQYYLASFVDAVMSSPIMTSNPACWLALRHAIVCANRLAAYAGQVRIDEDVSASELIESAAAVIAAVIEASDAQVFALMQSGSAIDMSEDIHRDIVEGRGALWLSYVDYVGGRVSEELGLQFAGLVAGYERSLQMELAQLAKFEDVDAYLESVGEAVDAIGRLFEDLSKTYATCAIQQGHDPLLDAKRVKSYMHGYESSYRFGGASDYCDAFGIAASDCVFTC